MRFPLDLAGSVLVSPADAALGDFVQIRLMRITVMGLYMYNTYLHNVPPAPCPLNPFVREVGGKRAGMRQVRVLLTRYIQYSVLWTGGSCRGI